MFSLPRLGRCQTLDIHRMDTSKMKGRVKSSDVIIIAEKQCDGIHFSGVNSPRVTKPAHELSFHMSMSELKIVLDF